MKMKKIALFLFMTGLISITLCFSSAEASRQQKIKDDPIPVWDAAAEKAATDILEKNCVEKLNWDDKGIKLTLLYGDGSWYKVIGLDEQDVLKCVSKVQYYTGAELHIVGSPSTDTWLLVPQKPGDVRIFFDRMFLSREKPLRRVILHVHVDEDLHYTVGLEAPAEGGI